MSIKIAVTETRECCQERDLKQYNGQPVVPGAVWPYPGDIRFCQYCGQLHVERRHTDAAGSTDTRWEKWP